jgi:16S rRNA (uracil1498-N3)-methyltransferase
MSGSIRLYLTVTLTAGCVIETTAQQAHYLGTVMRRRVGDPVGLFNGRDGEWLARIETIRRDRAKLVVDRLLRAQRPEPDLWLLFALLKRDATDLVVQKATELGVATLRPVLTARANGARVNVARLAAIAIEAAEQSERLTVPELHQPQLLRAVLASWPAGRRLIVAVERSQAPLIPPVPAPAALLVGPEGGFDSAELETLRAQPFVTACSLGPRILRAETACIAGLALLQAR